MFEIKLFLKIVPLDACTTQTPYPLSHTTVFSSLTYWVSVNREHSIESDQLSLLNPEFYFLCECSWEARMSLYLKRKLRARTWLLLISSVWDAGNQPLAPSRILSPSYQPAEIKQVGSPDGSKYTLTNIGKINIRLQTSMKIKYETWNSKIAHEIFMK